MTRAFIGSVGTWVVTSVLSGWLLTCSRSDAAPPHQSPVEIPDAGMVEDAGCVRVTIAATSAGCRGQWICDSTIDRTLLCSPDDAGVLCSCIEGDAATPTLGIQPCTDPADVPTQAKTLCGWEVP